jgi:hypothetical protein
MGKYVLDERGEPKLCQDLHVWARWYEKAFTDKTVQVALTFLEDRKKRRKVRVSTVFLSLDHGFDKTPILWETAVFGDERFTENMDRCGGSREQALAMHDRMVKLIQRLLDDEKSKEASHRRR